jgi:hypothetical protein
MSGWFVDTARRWVGSALRSVRQWWLAWSVGGGLLLIVSGLVVSEYLVPRWQLRQTGTVAVPTAAASPEDVVRAFARAQDVHDEVAERAMSAPVYLGLDGSASWDVAHFRLVRITLVRRSPPEERAGRMPEIRDARQVVEVSTVLDLTPTWSVLPADGELWRDPDFTMVRNSDDEMWKVAEVGVG